MKTKDLSLNLKRVRKSVRTDVNTGKTDTVSFVRTLFCASNCCTKVAGDEAVQALE